MPRPVWTGAISFGLVTIPIKVTAATEDHSIRFHQYHLEDMARVRTKKICEIEDREVTQAEIGKGYEYAKDQIVAISDEELREIPLPTAKAIEIVAFVPYESIDRSASVRALPRSRRPGRSETVCPAQTWPWSGML